MTIIRTSDSLHPEFRRRVDRLYNLLIWLHEADISQFRFEIFETFRSFDRQERLKAKRVSKAAGGESAHQFGLAADFVPFLTQAQGHALGVPAGWYWPEPSDKCWKVLNKAAVICGLHVPITWDKAHVEFPDWKKHRHI